MFMRLMSGTELPCWSAMDGTPVALAGSLTAMSASEALTTALQALPVAGCHARDCLCTVQTAPNAFC